MPSLVRAASAMSMYIDDDTRQFEARLTGRALPFHALIPRYLYDMRWQSMPMIAPIVAARAPRRCPYLTTP